MALGYVPPVYMWIVTYLNGQALPQFDPVTGRENYWAQVDQWKVKSVGWFPISNFMADKILEGEGVIARVRDIPRYEITLKTGQRPYMRRTSIIPPGQYHECLECGYKWIFAFGKPDPNVERQGFKWHGDRKFYCVTCASQGTNTELLKEGRKGICPNEADHKNKAQFKRYQVAVCPSCRYHNLATDTKEELRIISKITNMEYLIYKIGVEEGPHFMINEWGEVIDA